MESIKALVSGLFKLAGCLLLFGAVVGIGFLAILLAWMF